MLMAVTARKIAFCGCWRNGLEYPMFLNGSSSVLRIGEQNALVVYAAQSSALACISPKAAKRSGRNPTCDNDGHGEADLSQCVNDRRVEGKGVMVVDRAAVISIDNKVFHDGQWLVTTVLTLLLRTGGHATTSGSPQLFANFGAKEPRH
jgi:hypothetical protein